MVLFSYALHMYMYIDALHTDLYMYIYMELHVYGILAKKGNTHTHRAGQQMPMQP